MRRQNQEAYTTTTVVEKSPRTVLDFAIEATEKERQKAIERQKRRAISKAHAEALEEDTRRHFAAMEKRAKRRGGCGSWKTEAIWD